MCRDQIRRRASVEDFDVVMKNSITMHRQSARVTCSDSFPLLCGHGMPPLFRDTGGGVVMKSLTIESAIHLHISGGYEDQGAVLWPIYFGLWS